VFLPLSVSPNSIPIDLAPNGGAQNVTLTFTGLPNYVALGDLELKYGLPLQSQDNGNWGENGTHGGFEKFTRVFLVDAPPTGLQGIPWADFLEYTCRWAWGAAGSTDLKEKMTRGMHYSNRSAVERLRYDYTFNHFAQIEDDDYGYTVYMGAATRDLEDPSDVYTKFDCNAFAVFLRCAFAAHGVQSNVILLSESPMGPSGFKTNLLCPAWADPTSPPANYQNYEFNVHVVTRSNDLVFDASSAYDYDLVGSPYQNPVVFWSVPLHWRNVWGGEDYGLVDDSVPPGLPVPQLLPPPVIEAQYLTWKEPT
jgi:hypothetical protein